MGVFLLLIFIAVPVIEIGLFIQVGGFIGLFPTLAIVVITAFIGTYLLKRQGLSIILKLQQEFAAGKLPVENLIHGAFIVVAGLLLLTPGFFTDFIGFSFFIPQIRLAVAGLIGKQFKKANYKQTSRNRFYFHSSFNDDAGFNKNQAHQNQNSADIEGEYNVVDETVTKLTSQDDHSKTVDKPSPWNKID